MKIELSKETSVNSQGSIGVIGKAVTWHWVRIYDDKGEKVFGEPFLEEEDARKYYQGLIDFYAQFSTYQPVIDVLASVKMFGKTKSNA